MTELLDYEVRVLRSMVVGYGLVRTAAGVWDCSDISLPHRGARLASAGSALLVRGLIEPNGQNSLGDEVFTITASGREAVRSIDAQP